MVKDVEGEHDESVLLESPVAAADMLKSAAHPARVQVLALLREKEQSLAYLMGRTGLSKNALANHMRLLTDLRLVTRVARGKYRLSEDGAELVDALAGVYESSLHREMQRAERIRRLYSGRTTDGEKMTKQTVSKKVEYLPCWISYNGAVAGSLRALGMNCDVVDVGGRSGYSFLINVCKGVTCESGPTAMPNETWDMIRKGTESLGVEIEHWSDDNSYPASDKGPTPEELEKVKRLFERVKKEINEKDRPVVLWGLGQPEYGIVKGYDGDSYVVSTFRSLIGSPDTPIPYHDLKAPGCLDAYYFKEKMKPNPSADKEAVQRAVDFASGNVPVLSRYVAGPAALDDWAGVLESVPESKQNYFGNSYVGACYQEGREVSAAFLKRLARGSKGKRAKRLNDAAKSYEKGAELMAQFTKLFPFKMEGAMRAEDRKKGAELLRKVKSAEEEAIGHLRMALKEWD